MPRRLTMMVACIVLLGFLLVIAAIQPQAAQNPPVVQQPPATQNPPVSAQPPAGQAPGQRGRGQAGPPPAVAPIGKPVAVVDLTTNEGSAVFEAQWKVMDVKVVEVPASTNLSPAYKTTYDIDPHANVAGFDDSSWPTVEPKSLPDNRGGGKFCFVWYRTHLTMPSKVGTVDVTGAKAVLIVMVDDYTEVWINGLMPRAVGMPSPQTIQGFNVPSRIPVGDTVKPGEKFEVAVFGINGPLSLAPGNRVWVREMTMEFFR